MIRGKSTTSNTQKRESVKSGKGKAQQESEGATKGSRLCWVHDVLAKAGTG